MPELLKNVYSREFLVGFVKSVKQVLPHFNQEEFLQQIFDENWEAKELKQRMRHIAVTLKNNLEGSYNENISAVLAIIKHLQATGVKENSFPYMFFPDFVELYGLDDLKTSLKAIETITQFTSCEFAIRPFILKYPEAVMDQMLKWSKHKSHLVRRFSSEGCRPRLPWAMTIPQFKKDPSPILPILENLKNDPSLFVRKSVANNLNDISRDNPEVVIKLAKEWKGDTPETDWIIRHSCRTLLKKADKNIYKIFGLNATAGCEVQDLKLLKSKIKLGEQLDFSFKLKLSDLKGDKLRIEYVIYYVKANGSHSKKIFKLAEARYAGDKVHSFKRHQRFLDFTTRKHYSGKHKIGIVVNGQELATKEFLLTV